MKYSVVVPAHNEANNIGKLVRQISYVLNSRKEDFEIIVVNDNSTDQSVDVLEKLREEISQLNPIHRNKDRGVGNAIREGLMKAQGEIIITMDGDLSHDPREIPKFLQALDECDMVCGSRYLEGGRADMPLSRRIISRFFNSFFGFLFKLPTTDFTSGFRAYRREVVESLDLKSKEFGIYVEIPIKAFLRGYRIKETPIHYKPRLEGKSKLSYLEQGPEYLKVITNVVALKISTYIRRHINQLFQRFRF